MKFYIIYIGSKIVRTLYADETPIIEGDEAFIEMDSHFDISCCSVVDGFVVGDISARTQMLQEIEKRKRKAEIEQMAIRAAVALLSPEIQAEYAELEV